MCTITRSPARSRKHDRVGRWRLLDDRDGTDEIERKPGMETALGGERDTGDGAPNIAVDVPEENVAHISMALEQIQEPLGLFKAELVDLGKAEFDRWVMHEDIGRPPRRFAEPGIEPRNPPFAQFAGNAPFGQCVEKQQRCPRRYRKQIARSRCRRPPRERQRPGWPACRGFPAAADRALKAPSRPP